MLSIRGTDFIAHWAYEEQISVYAQPAVKCEQFLHVQSMLSIRGTNFIACWAYVEPISSHAEHAWKCLKVGYLGRNKYDFQKSRVTGPWVSVSAKKVQKKISWLCTFNRPSQSSDYANYAKLKLVRLDSHDSTWIVDCFLNIFRQKVLFAQWNNLMQ